MIIDDSFVFPSNWGSWVLPDTHPRQWLDEVAAIWYRQPVTVMNFADGHADSQIWVDRSTVEMGESPDSGFFLYPEDSGKDLLFMQMGYHHDWIKEALGGRTATNP